MSEEAFENSPFREIEYSYRFAKERMAQTERLLKAPLAKRIDINQAVLRFEEKLTGDPLIAEEEFRGEVERILAG